MRTTFGAKPGGEVRGEMHLGNFGRDLSQYPYLLILEQSNTRSVNTLTMKRNTCERAIAFRISSWMV